MAEAVPISVVPAFSTVWAVFGKNEGDAYAMRVVAWAFDASRERPWDDPVIHSTPMVEMFDPDGTFFGVECVSSFSDYKGVFRLDSEEDAIRVAFSKRAKG